MGKTGKALKKRKLALAAQAAQATLEAGSDDELGGEASFLGGLVSEGQLAVTVKTLQTLTQHPHLLAHKQDLKALRTAVFDFQRVGNELAGTGNSLSSRISAALTQHRHVDALVLLAEMRIRGQHPKLGALQRWTRELDAASRSDGSFGDEMALKVLDGVLRTCNEHLILTAEQEAALQQPKQGEVVVRQTAWAHREPSGECIYDEVKAGKFPSPEDRERLASAFSLLQETPGPERLPPNLHPALLYASRPGTIPLSSTPVRPVTRVEAPHVPGGFMLTDVLSPEECRSIIGHAEAVGFKPDQPLGEEQTSVLAHNLYWLADREFLDVFCARFLHLVPQAIDGGRVTGINARFRVYRYVPGSCYRPHIDGAWPASGVDPVTGEYLYDSSPADKPQWSKLTLLIYLNDDFDNGCTTFFLPSSRPGTLNAFPIKPARGCAMVFVHGDARGSLLHEGSPVGEGGAKYVIRTEVLYETKPVGFGIGGKEGEVDENVVA
ncbi:hypothetical protein JCM10213_002076 [Rhodosporidiobolus nylandii]